MSIVNGRVTAVLTAYLVSLRQLGNGKSMSRTEFARLMLPHEVKSGQLKSIEGKKLFDWSGEDCEVIPAKLFDQKVATDAWLNNIVTAVNVNLLGSASEQAEDEDEPDEDINEPEDINDDVVAPDDEAVDTSALDKAIKKGKGKKAKKLLAEIEDELSKAEYKTYKKQIKEL